MKKYLLYLTLLFATLSLCSCKKLEKSNQTNASSDYLILVNKNNSISKDYVPKDLVNVTGVDYIKRENEVMKLNKKALECYQLLYNEAKKEGYNLTIFSAYRSYEKQQTLWEARQDENYVAKPGQSEHQTGLSVDISTRDIGITTNFMNSDAYKFLINNAYKYGFIIRYPKDKEDITGYYFEPWHYRYVGIDVSTKIFENKLTLEEYLSYPF